MKEAKASPVKTGALGLLLLVAIWFWGPLVMKWMHPEEEVAAEIPSAAEPNLSAAVIPTGAVAATLPTLEWRAVQKLRETDPRVRPLRLEEKTRDPFWKKAAAIAANEPSEKPESASLKPEGGPVPPEEAGLVLQGTLISARRKLATINGRNFEEGTVVIAGGAQNAGDKTASPGTAVAATQELEYRLVEITPASVMLEHRGSEFTLPLHKPAGTNSERMQIERKRAG